MSNNPFTHNPAPEPSPQDSTVKTLLIILSIVGVLSLVMCAGVAGMGYYAFQEIQQQIAELETVDIYSQEDIAVVLTDALGDSPELVEEIGEINAITFDSERSLLESADTDPSEEPPSWFQAAGKKGSAALRVTLADDGDQWFQSVSIVRPDGSTRELPVAEVPYDSLELREIYLFVRESPAIQEGIGPIKRIYLDWERTDKETAEDDLNYWYRVEGPLGAAFVLLDEEDDLKILEIQLSEGKEVDLNKKDVPPLAPDKN